MRWPWRKRKPSATRLRRENLTYRLESVVASLESWYEVRGESIRELCRERDQLKADLKEALLHQLEQADRIFQYERAICSHCGKTIYPQPPAPPSKSDPDYDAAMAHAELEDTLKTRR